MGKRESGLRLIPTSHHLIATFMVTFLFIMISPLSAQNKVVVIPLTKIVQAPIEPYAPVTAPSPSNTDYTVGFFTVTDNVTDLIWQKEDDNIPRTWDEAWDYCQGLEHPPMKSLTDWRLPRIDELATIVNYNNENPAINSYAFPNTNFSSYWSATTIANDSGFALAIDFSSGTSSGSVEDGSSNKLSENYVRCVRQSSIGQNAFENNGDGTVTDLATGLMWQREDDNAQRSWSNAASFCQGLILGDKEDWRMPNIKELQSIIDTTINYPNPAIDTATFPSTDTTCYWSATSFASGSSLAWCVDFEDGETLSNGAGGFFFVRCVR